MKRYAWLVCFLKAMHMQLYKQEGHEMLAPWDILRGRANQCKPTPARSRECRVEEYHRDQAIPSLRRGIILLRWPLLRFGKPELCIIACADGCHGPGETARMEVPMRDREQPDLSA